jgi:hypothetical protein
MEVQQRRFVRPSEQNNKAAITDFIEMCYNTNQMHEA